MAEVGIGMKGFLGFGEESTYGLPVARTKFLEINSESINKTRPLIESGALYREGILDTKFVQGAVEVGGDVEFDAQYEGWLKLLKHVMGQVTTSQPDVTGAPTVYRHLFQHTPVLPTGLTFEVFRDTSGFVSEPNKSFIYQGCKVTSLQIQNGVGELLRVTASIMAQNEIRAAKSVEAFSSSRLAAYHQGTLKWDGSDAEVASYNLTINNSLGTRPKLGSQLTREPLRDGKLMVSGSFQGEFDTWAKHDDFLNAQKKVLNIRYNGNVIQGGLQEYIDMNMTVAVITGYRVVLNSPGRIIAEFDFKAYRTTSIGELEVTVQNTESSI